jgi:Tol biopolymer transport system component
MDRAGKSSDPIGVASPAFGNATTLRLSTNGRTVAFHEQVAGNTDIWIYDLERNLRTRLTTDAALDEFPAWSPDGEKVIFASARSGQLSELYIKPSNGAVAEQLLLKLEPGMAAVPRDWSLDGQLLLFERTTGALQSSQHDIWALPFGGDRKPFPYLATSFTESQPALSPNGRWVAYVSNETGSANQVFVQPFPDPSKGKWQLSTTGGAYPRWKRDGRELYYLDRDRRIVAVSVTTEGKFELGKSTPLFTTPIPFPSGVSVDIPYDVTADGQHFLISASLAQAPAPNTTPIAVILNWPLMLKR